MAQENRLLTQVDYFDWVIQQLMREPKKIYISTFGLTTWPNTGSRVVPLLNNQRKIPTQAIVGHNSFGLQTAVKTAQRFSRVEWRFNSNLHCKFVLVNFDTGWEGVIGSQNFVDSTMLNLSVEMRKREAKLVAKIFEDIWVSSTPFEKVRANLADMSFTQKPLTQPNDATENIRF